MSTKANLKAAKAALDAGDYGKAVVESQIVLASDSQNHFAKLFLARALEKQSNFDDAAKTYHQAAKSKPNDSQAWLGLCSVYEAQGAMRVDEYIDAAVKAAEVFAEADDKHRCQSIIDKLTSSVKQNGTTAQQKHMLELLLPGNTVADYLEGRIQHPSTTYLRLVEITEEEEAQRIKQEINERRTRIGARLGQVTTDVKREVFASSQLETLYQELINWSNDDEVRRQYEEKLLERAYEGLTILQPDAKAEKLNQVLTLAEGMVIIKHPFQVAWDLVLETRDMDDLRDLDVNILREYTILFPDSGLAKILQAWLSSELSPFPPPPKDEQEDNEKEPVKALTAEDRLLMVTEGLSAAGQSVFAHRLVSDYYLHLDEYETTVETARAGLKVAQAESQKLGMSLQNTLDAINGFLATALVHFQAPRNHPEARRLFEDILRRNPRSTPALIGLGLILEETEDYQDAIRYFTQALEQDPENVNVGTELAWCRALCGDYARAAQDLEAYLPRLKVEDPRARDLRAQVLYRIGICVWRLDDSKTARKDRNGAYSRFLAAIKTNVNFAPAYTSLGYYYADYSKDKKRARQCFQKAFELSSAETDAAERLAKFFADQADWDIVEVIAQRVVDSGRARPPPGSKRKGISWPYSALGVVQMNKQDYSQAIVSFLAALRISPDDYQSYVGLGESYHNSGRYNSALRTFSFALDPPEGTPMKVNGETWFARYMLANVHRELGDYDDAIEGLEAVLKERPHEFGVQMSLLQTFVEKACRCLDIGLYGQAVASASQAIAIATNLVKDSPHAFNLWKAVGDACLLFSRVGSALAQFPTGAVQALLDMDANEEAYDLMADVDRIQHHNGGTTNISGEASQNNLPAPLTMGILAYKRAISSCSHDLHAQAVAWYNLGWAEHRANLGSDAKGGKKYLRTAVRCFKKAIELEAGNAEFWNALGVVTTTLNPKVAQHAFVRSLHLNELNAKVWANLGVLYLLENDHDLAHSAFGRAQSTDPDYGHAWVGEGVIALLLGDTKEALNHFTHAFEISDSASTITKRQYALSSFDNLLAARSESNDVTRLIQPVFALEQLRTQVPNDLPYRHLAALFLERIGNRLAAVETLLELCADAEAEYEQTESLTALARFAHAKSDLARCQLATSDFKTAAENAETALDLTLDADNSGLDVEARTRLRLSAHLTAGLAAFSLNDVGTAIGMFRKALQESNSNPDAVCLLVKVLWAHGGSEEKTVARDQLFGCVERHPDHVASVTLLGAIAALDDDETTASAVMDDLLALRLKDGLHLKEQAEVEDLIAALSALRGDSTDITEVTEAQSAVMLKPDHPSTWSHLSELSGESYAAAMALRSAEKAVPPQGEIETAELADSFARVGTVGDAQRATSLAPWKPYGWEAMSACAS
ncbi:Superkiller protein 3 [Elasticomyces elasticus]|nr:Superkiller protein 3 [Elasticomyces elasticus]KAK3628076.1 Superkiller protein 3 [Elasticomyces elasticus]KAK4907047.1 Superkiller protein 3 [Elasticomyces elasticus]KAK5742749.1 Superkiller protein 3 [Elasticomyces elasticus]